MGAGVWGDLAVESVQLPIEGGTLAVTLAGRGPALVLLHGISSQGTAWLPVAAELARDYRLVIVDQRGHGNSLRPESGYLERDYADDLQQVLDQLGIERPLIAGHSLGGMVALDWATRNPKRAAAIVVEDSPMRRGGEGVAELFDEWIMVASMSADEAETYYAGKSPEQDPAARRRRAESITSVAPGVFTELKADMLAQGGAVIIDRYAPIASPVLLVYGDLETGSMVPPPDAALFRQAIAGSEVAKIPGGSHSLHNDMPDAFLAIVKPFLAKHASAASRIDEG